MRILIFLIITSAFLLWYGINFRHSGGKAPWVSLIIGVILALFFLVGFFRLI